MSEFVIFGESIALDVDRIISLQKNGNDATLVKYFEGGKVVDWLLYTPFVEVVSIVNTFKTESK